MLNLNKKNFFRLTFLISLFALISAYFIEYILGHQPCNLCLIERIPYMGALIIIAINFKFNHLEKFLIFLLIFVIVSLISRSLRFFIISYLSYKFGDLFSEFMNKHGSKWFTILGLLIILIFFILLLILKFNA